MRPLEELLSRLKNVQKQGDREWSASCPNHDDRKNSLCVSEGEDGKALVKCQAGCVTPAVLYSVGMTMRELFPDHGMSEGDRKRPKGKVVAHYDYKDEDGALLLQVCRMDPKDFRQRRPDGDGGWIWNLNGVRRVLYRLPELIASASDESRKSLPVIVCEGEKDVDRLYGLGLVATTNVGGAGKWKKEYGKWLAGRDVAILPDNDQPGQDHAAKVALALSGVARTVKIINLPSLPEKGDVSDWLNAGGSREALLEVCSAATTADPHQLAATRDARQAAKDAVAAEKADPASLHFEEKLLAELGLDVLGEVDGTKGFVKVFSEHHRKSDIIHDVGKMTYERLIQLAGPVVKAKVHVGQDDVDGVYRMSEVRKAIALLSGFRRIDDTSEVGVGCWRGNGSESPCIVAVGAGEAAKWPGATGALERIAKPRVDGLLLDIGGSDPWYDFAELADMLARCDRDWALAAIRESEVLFERWRWRADGSPLVVVGLILATWVQTIWDWRPQVAIIGRSNSGKSMLFGALSGIFGRLAIKSSQSSAAGIRQSVRNSASIILADEFESGRHRSDILEMLRASSRGDTVFRGTSGHKGQAFSLRHIAWVAAIESGLSREPDKNRFITLELIAPKPENVGKLVLPPDGELATLGKKLLAVSLRYGLAARLMASNLKSKPFEGVHARLVESYAVPASIVASLLGLDETGATNILGKMLTTAETDETGEGDEGALLGDILGSIVEYEKGQRATVSQIIASRKVNSESDYALERVGLGVFEGQDKKAYGKWLLGDYLFVAHNSVQRHLLRNTNWQGQKIDQILRRLDGAVKMKKSIAGSLPWGVMVPMRHVLGSETD